MPYGGGGSGGGGAGTWGSITGTLSAQTDLNSALGAKANSSSLGTAATHPATDFDAAGAAATVNSALSTHAGLSTTAHGGIVASSDSRLTNSRTPTAHAASHAAAGSDPLTLTAAQISDLNTAVASTALLYYFNMK